jgi:hypothetical protein
MKKKKPKHIKLGNKSSKPKKGRSIKSLANMLVEDAERDKGQLNTIVKSVVKAAFKLLDKGDGKRSNPRPGSKEAKERAKNTAISRKQQKELKKRRARRGKSSMGGRGGSQPRASG